MEDFAGTRAQASSSFYKISAIARSLALHSSFTCTKALLELTDPPQFDSKHSVIAPLFFMHIKCAWDSLTLLRCPAINPGQKSAPLCTTPQPMPFWHAPPCEMAMGQARDSQMPKCPLLAGWPTSAMVCEFSEAADHAVLMFRMHDAW
jgi:hypothetical protein